MTRTFGGRSPSSVLGRIQTTWPASPRRLTPFRRDGPVGSARAASRYKVGRGMIIETPSSSVLLSAFEEGISEPDQRRGRPGPVPPCAERPGARGAGGPPSGPLIRGGGGEEGILGAGSPRASPGWWGEGAPRGT